MKSIRVPRTCLLWLGIICYYVMRSKVFKTQDVKALTVSAHAQGDVGSYGGNGAEKRRNAPTG